MCATSLSKYFSTTASAAVLLLFLQASASAGSGTTAAGQPHEKGSAGKLRTVGAYPEERGVGHTVTPLPDGRLFVYGHAPGAGAIDSVFLDPRARSAERSTVAPLMWDPLQRTWRKLDNPPQCEYSAYLHTATALPDARILIAGGLCDALHRATESRPHKPHKALAIWNDQRKKWEHAPTLSQSRIYHTATLLADSSVMFVGGVNDIISSDKTEPVLDSVEQFSKGHVSQLAALGFARARHTATRIGSDAVLVAGGIGKDGKAVASVEIWDAKTQAWKDGPPLKQPRHSHSASLLSDGRILVAGGINPDRKAIDTVEIFDPGTNKWSDSAPMLVPLRRHETVVLSNDDVLLIGVGQDGDHYFSQAMLRENTSGDWLPAGHLFPDRFRWSQSYSLAAVPGMQDDVRVFDSGVVMQWSRADDGAEAVSPYGLRNNYTSIQLKDGRILIAGGNRSKPGQFLLDWAEIFDPKTGLFSLTGRMTQVRNSFSALTLDDGKVIVASNRTPLALRPNPHRFAELWDPTSGQWTALTEIDFEGSNSAVFENFGKLSDGRVLLIFSADKEYRALIWDPHMRTVDTRPISATHRVGAAIGITPSGRVLIESGMIFRNNGHDLGIPEVWDSRTNRVDTLTSPPSLRREASDTLVLRDGNVLLMDRKGYKSETQGGVVLWDAASGAWHRLPALPIALHREAGLFELHDGSIAADTFLLRPGASAWTVVPDYPQNHATLLQLQSGHRMALSAMHPHVALFDEAKGRWQPQAGYYLRRKPEHKPVLVELSDGRVMVAGNVNQPGMPKETTIQIWDPKTDVWATTGKLSNVYPRRMEAALLPSGQVLYVGQDRSETLRCEIGHPADDDWTDCSATLPIKGERPEFTLGPMADGRIALLFGQSEAYAYSEQNKQWLQVSDIQKLVSNNPGVFDGKRRLPDGCSISGLPFRFFSPQRNKELQVASPETGIRPHTARMIALSDGTVVVAGYPEGANEIYSGFFHRKASCAGFEAQPNDAFMPGNSSTAPTVAAFALLPESKIQRLYDAIVGYKWIMLTALALILLYYARRKRYRSS